LGGQAGKMRSGCVPEDFFATAKNGFKHRKSARFHLAGTLGLQNNSPDCFATPSSEDPPEKKTCFDKSFFIFIF
jgi:hypothetical protein